MEKPCKIFDEVEDFVARDEIDTDSGYLPPALRRQQQHRGGDLAEPKRSALA
jgi:hypothetical protein